MKIWDISIFSLLVYRESPNLPPNRAIVPIRLVVENALVVGDRLYFLGEALRLQSSSSLTISWQKITIVPNLIWTSETAIYFKRVPFQMSFLWVLQYDTSNLVAWTVLLDPPTVLRQSSLPRHIQWSQASRVERGSFWTAHHLHIFPCALD